MDGGATWKALTSGLPTEGVGRSGLAIAPSNPKRIYAVIDAKEGGLFRSDDAGATWTRTTNDPRVWGRGWYFEKVVVDPTVQMSKELAALRQTTGAVSGRDLETMLGALSAAPLPSHPPAGIEYNAGELRVRGLATNQDEADPIAAALGARGYTVTLQGDALVITRGGRP